MLIAVLGLGGLASLLPVLTGPAIARQRAGRVLAALALALVLVFALYYAHWLPEMRAQVAQVLGGGGRGGSFDPGALPAGIGRRLSAEWGGGLALGGLAGLLAIISIQPTGARRRLVAAWVVGALAAGLVFAALDQTVGDSIRYPLLLAPWIALGAGAFWGLLARRGAAGPLFVAVLAATALWHLLGVWLTQIFTRYH
jgi:hypothetical protein